MDAELRIANAKAVVEYWLENESFGMKNPALRVFAENFKKALDGEPCGIPDDELGRRVRRSQLRSKRLEAPAAR